MRRKDREVTDRGEVMGIIRRCQVCRLGLCDRGTPYVVPMNFGVEQEDGQVVVYLHSAKTGRKLDILRENPAVCLEFDGGHRLLTGDVACAHSFAYESVIGFGRAEILDSYQEKAAGLAAILRHLAGKAFTFTPEQAAHVAVLRVRLDTVSGKRRAVG
ncbi:pyridoxamine 5'-phosphate oxidase family protein [Acutalibacter caecimuris]|uniref:pyridoxamine 5'-phosphate oxidase family protein n=1 Tax=Acutalibacter caecimuris TaxID=3093657 RepID=UPI002AC8AD00|nr:pyridoxamine 5'-phosphate oxidase family protein [Acutalibacter sp. M00118]